MSSKLVRTGIVLALIGLTGIYFMLKKLPQNSEWLLGNWWYDAPEEVAQDGLVFHRQGRMQFVDSDGKVLRRCRWTVLVENQTTVRCVHNGVTSFVVYQYVTGPSGRRELKSRDGKVYFKQ